MPDLGCTLIQKNKGIACDLSITWNFETKRGSWKKLKVPVRPATRNRRELNFGEKGDVFEAIDQWKGKEVYALSLYEPGAADNVAARAFVHIFCGHAKSVFERVNCGKSLSGKALMWRIGEEAEYEFWFSCT